MGEVEAAVWPQRGDGAEPLWVSEQNARQRRERRVQSRAVKSRKARGWCPCPCWVPAPAVAPAGARGRRASWLVQPQLLRGHGRVLAGLSARFRMQLLLTLFPHFSARLMLTKQLPYRPLWRKNSQNHRPPPDSWPGHLGAASRWPRRPGTPAGSGQKVPGGLAVPGPSAWFSRGSLAVRRC